MMLIAGVVSLVAVLLLGLFVVVLGDDEGAEPPGSGPAGSGDATTTSTVADQAGATTATVPTTLVPLVSSTVADETPTSAVPGPSASTTPPTGPPTAAPTTANAAPTSTEVLGPSGPAFARNPRFSLQVDETGRPAPEVVTIPDGVTHLCLTWDFFDVPLGIPLRMEWYIDGELSTSFDGVNDVGSFSGVYFACNQNPAGLASGLHEIEWTADGTFVFRHGWYVGEGSIPIDVELRNTAGGLDLCDVRVSPQAATSFGIPLNLTPVPAGESFVVSVPDGVYDVQARACDGTIVTEEYGIDVLGPMTIDV